MLSAYECESDRNICPGVVPSDADLVVRFLVNGIFDPF